ncbi:hypothetical protein AYL99_08365 [Fonsecaea erecta]|uniref:amidase n=1 Tax=Fonsecaea erecta TaxID=1367422 RepID=A0A178ZCX3_9EURO|nr:hypothetical protein AYL99_08365 [Fonsecaea erecta]OAP57627.1 hypothetical protein AYL99_08365 [Fonsecaea erecta]
MTIAPDWRSIAKATQESILKKIPKEWCLVEGNAAPEKQDVSKIPESCDILSLKERDITGSVDATFILKKIHSRQWTAEEVMVAFCKRAAIAHQLTNCLTEICFEEAITQAKVLDAELQRTGKLAGPLHGLPISLKDHINVAGLRSTMGYCCLAENRPEEDAVITKVLKAAGGIIFVKTTMPVTGMVTETTSNLFGRTTLGHNRLLTPGGSSGGEGALIGLRGSPMGWGTDVGGSIRVPAAFSGIYGFKPSSRRLSVDGLSANVRGAISIPGVIGPMSLSIRDLELVCKVLTDAEPWLEDPNVSMKEWKPRPKIERSLRIGVMAFDGVVMPHPPILRAIKTAANQLHLAGHDVIDFEPFESLKAWEIAFPIYYATGGKEMRDLIEASGEPWPPAAGKISNSPAVRDRKLTVKELYELNAARDQYKKGYLQHWKKTATQTKTGKPIDVLLCPTAASASFPHDFVPWWGYSSQYNMLDMPGVVIPVGKVDKTVDVEDKKYSPINERDQENYDMYDPELWDGAPLGVQIVGRNFDDEFVLACASIIDEVLNGRDHSS